MRSKHPVPTRGADPSTMRALGDSWGSVAPSCAALVKNVVVVSKDICKNGEEHVCIP